MATSAEQLAQFAQLLRRLCREDYPLQIDAEFALPPDDDARMRQYRGMPLNQLAGILTDDNWDGLLGGTVRLSDLKLTARRFAALRPMDQCDACRYALAQAVLWSHLADFEQYMTLIHPGTWERAAVAPRQDFSSDLVVVPMRRSWFLVFFYHATALADALNVELLVAARECEAPRARIRRHVLIDRFAMLLHRLTRPDYPVRVTSADYQEPSTTRAEHPANRLGFKMWGGFVKASVDCRDLGVGTGFIDDLLPLLRERTEWVDLLAEAVLTSHCRDFEAWLATLAAAAWDHEARGRCHRHWGLELAPPQPGAPPQLWFLGAAQRLATLIDTNLQQAAIEGENERDDMGGDK